MKNVVVVDFTRTPFGRGGRGKLAATRLDTVSASVLKDLLSKHPALPLSDIGEVGLGQVLHADELLNMGSAQISHLAGLPYEIAKFECNRQCGSSMEVVHRLTHAMMLGVYDVGIAMGVERMGRYLSLQSSSPTRITSINPEYMRYQSDIQRSIPPYYQETLSHSIPDSILQSPPLCMMPQTAQNIADMYQLTRESCDAFALESHHKYQKALSANYYDKEITPLTIEEPVFDDNHKLDLSQHGPESRFSHDECFRADVTMEQLSDLPALKGITSYEKAPVIITPGNSCPTNDGFAASLLLTEAKAEALGIQPMARIIGFAVTGVKPQIMGLGPVSAITKALKYAEVSLSDVDFIEFNEAFSAQVIACMQELEYPLHQVNLRGGSLAIGHPLGATGVRLVGSCARQLSEGSGRYAVAAQCIGAGMGIATVLESIR